jgi:hypothetical protein
MNYDPLSEVVDEPLVVSEVTLQQLSSFRAADKFLELPGVAPADERKRLSVILNALLDRLIAGISENSTKLWVMKQFQLALSTVSMEDTEVRDQFGTHLEMVMDILHIENSDGLLGFYL